MKARAAILGAISLMGLFNAACSIPASAPAEPAPPPAPSAAAVAMLEYSTQRCTPHGDPPAYYGLLEAVIGRHSDQTLTILRAHDIAICLDTRLAGQKVGQRSNIDMVYYGPQRIIAIADNGKPYTNTEPGEENSAYYSWGEVRVLAARLERGEIDNSEIHYGFSYRTRSRHRSRSHVIIKSESQFESTEFLSLNPWMRDAPETQSAPAPVNAAAVKASLTHNVKF